MKPESLHKVAETLRSARHRHLGITAYPPKPPNFAPATRMEHRDLPSFSTAMDRARGQWPTGELCLIGADGVVGSTNIDDPTDTLPAGFLQFLDPDILLRIPVGDPEDQGDQID